MTFGVNDYSASQHQFTPSPVGGAFCSQAQAKFGNAALDLFTFGGAGGEGFYTPNSTDFQFGSGQFTAEAWVYWTSHSAVTYEAILTVWGATILGWWLGMTNSGQLAFLWSSTGSDSNTIGAAYTPTLNSWTHIAVDRDASNVVRVYANGVVIASATVTNTLPANNCQMYIGNDQQATSRHLPGYIDEVRVSTVARYGGAFTPPTAAFTADSNTVLLVHFDAGALGSIGKQLKANQPAFQFSTVSGAGAVQTGKAPTPGPKTVSGIVTVNGSGTSGLIVRAYAKPTGELIGTATTAANGSYSINCGENWADVTVIAYDPTTYQALAFDRVVPS